MYIYMYIYIYIYLFIFTYMYIFTNLQNIYLHNLDILSMYVETLDGNKQQICLYRNFQNFSLKCVQ